MLSHCSYKPLNAKSIKKLSKSINSTTLELSIPINCLSIAYQSTQKTIKIYQRLNGRRAIIKHRNEKAGGWIVQLCDNGELARCPAEYMRIPRQGLPLSTNTTSRNDEEFDRAFDRLFEADSDEYDWGDFP